ncbi:MAG TPA: AAA family ATPase [Acidimicrobiales bacterium]|nr:AAA family ATPase [Acidimicrobiales bacterium]
MGTGTATGWRADPTRPPFVGRGDELARLRALAARLAEGRGGVVLVEGEAGIGKTRLLDEFALDAGRAGFELFRSRAEELERGRPFGAIAECLRLSRSSDPEVVRLVGLLLGEPPSDSAANPIPTGRDIMGARELWLIDAMVRVVEDACADRPVVVAVDDMQWADTETLLVLHRLCRLVGDLPLLVLGTCRPVPRTAALDRLRHTMKEWGGPPLRLGPLPATNVEDLVAGVLAAAPGPRLSRQVAGAAGNPFFVLELVAALQAGGAIRVGADRAEIDVVAFPPELTVAVLHRLSFLPDEVLDVVRMASMLGSRFRVQDLAVALGRTVVSLAPSVRHARQSGVLADDEERMAFRHDLIREALYEDIPRGLRMGLHRDIALALGAAGAPAVQVAEHFVRGATVGDPVAAEWVLRAADEVTTRSPNLAADLLKRAIDLFDRGDVRRDAVVANWLVSLDSAGRGGEAIKPCLELLSRPLAPAVEARMRLLLARLYSSSGRLDLAVEQARLVVAVPGLTDSQRARAMGWSTIAWVASSDLDTAEDLAGRTMALADAAGDPVGRALASGIRSTVALRRGRYQAALDQATAAFVAEDAQPSERMAQGTPYGNEVAAIARAAALMRLDRVDEAASLLDTTRDEVERRGFRRLLGMVFHLQAVHGYERGDWVGATVACQSLVELCDEASEREPTLDANSLLTGAGIRALVAVHRGDLPTARRLVGGQPVAPWVLGRWPDRAVVLLAEAAGQSDAAWDRASDAWDVAARAGTVCDFPLLGPDLIRLALAGADRAALARAHAAADEVEAVAEANPGVASLLGAARRCRGLLSADPTLLVEARSHFAQAGCALDAATAAEEAAVLLSRVDLAASRALLEEAITRYEGLEASWDAGRIIARMRELGLRRGSRAPRRRPTSGWDALTPAERAVVELVAQGMSNPDVAQRLFLSRATVKTHVSNALAKLQVSSRVELAREVARR